ncbi:LamG domain-containing protein, partial [Candidatus Dojkabacteria bacterium]|nr:LamG domain-containing protein [Candidatus Dojkabacteria bacterium]
NVNGRTPDLIYISGNIYAISYQGEGDDGYLMTIVINTAGYPSDDPTINPTSSYNPVSVYTWDSFIEAANKNGGEIYYQISDDDGTTWYYWNGSSWATAGAADYNTASVINTNIGTFNATNAKLMFKAFLESDGSQFIQIDSVSVSCTSGSPATFDDDDQIDFNAGIYNLTQWDGGNSWIELTSAGQTGGSGDYTSSIKDAGSPVPWQTISWNPQRPIDKELPNNAQAESGYTEGNANMSGNVLLMHMNESSGTISDYSGLGNNGTQSGGVTYGASGKLDTAISFDGSNDYVSVPDSSSLDITGDITIELWLYVRNYNNYPDIVGKGAWNEAYSIWMYSDGTFTFSTNNVDLWSSALSMNTWYHIVALRSGSTKRIYINGQLNAQGFYSSAIGTTATPFYVSSGSYPLNGIIDELAVYNRALSPTEVADHYKRGALRLQYQVRSCDDSNCSGESFVGPDGTGSTYYSELNNNTTGLPVFNLVNVADNQFFQYKSFFGTDDSLYTPELKSVSVGYFGTGGGSESLSVRVASGEDDAEEQNPPGGSMYLTSTDLELVSDGSIDQEVGMRFQNITVPPGSTITNAYVEFTADETDSGTTNLTFYGEDSDDASTFSGSSGDITNRTKTSASVAWNNVPAWLSVGATHQTPNLSSVIQEIIDRTGWASGNSLVIIVDGTGERTAESYNGSSSQAPLLVIEYEAGGGGGGVYQTEGYLTSSAYNMGAPSAIQVVSWSEITPSCSPACEIKFQIRAASDSGGSPGAWTDWYGPGGAGTFFINSSGTLVPLVLNGNQWVQYRVYLYGDGSNTPILEEIRVNYN